MTTAVMPAGRTRRRNELHLPLEPFRNWLLERERYYGGLAELAVACRCPERRLFAFKHGYENVSARKSGRYSGCARRRLRSVTLTFADHCLTFEGSAFLPELWPEFDLDLSDGLLRALFALDIAATPA